MDADGKKNDIISKTEGLLLLCNSVDEVTTRVIADRAGINPAMVNYYFGSKDELLKKAIQRIFEISDDPDSLKTGTGNPRKVMFDFLMSLGDRLLRYEKYGSIYVPYTLLSERISAPLILVPLLEEYFIGKKDEKECKLIAYQIISFIQLTLYRPDEFLEYSGVDVRNKNELRSLISNQLDIFLGDIL
jgi:AcrR family transcriptional regulator